MRPRIIALLALPLAIAALPAGAAERRLPGWGPLKPGLSPAELRRTLGPAALLPGSTAGPGVAWLRYTERVRLGGRDYDVEAGFAGGRTFAFHLDSNLRHLRAAEPPNERCIAANDAALRDLAGTFGKPDTVNFIDNGGVHEMLADWWDRDGARLSLITEYGSPVTAGDTGCQQHIRLEYTIPGRPPLPTPLRPASH